METPIVDFKLEMPQLAKYLWLSERRLDEMGFNLVELTRIKNGREQITKNGQCRHRCRIP